MDGTPGPQSYGHVNRHHLNSGSGYPNEHDSANAYMESTMSLNSGNYGLI